MTACPNRIGHIVRLAGDAGRGTTSGSILTRRQLPLREALQSVEREGAVSASP